VGFGERAQSFEKSRQKETITMEQKHELARGESDAPIEVAART
jgi:hypothetical protein